MKLASAIVGLFLSTSVFAWGPTGHRATGEIAEKYLTAHSQKVLSELLDGHSLSRVSTWPDEIRSEPKKYKHTFNWHYTDWPIDANNYDFKNNSGILLQSIKDQIKTLKNKKANKADRAWATKFIVHLVGDLHQPLHVGRGTDRGGNNCKVTFHGEMVKLHKLWDETMIDFTKLSYKEMAAYAMVRTPAELKEAKSGTLVDWAKESKVLRETIYPEDPSKDKAAGKDPSYCIYKKEYTADMVPKLRWGYSYEFMPVVEKRLFQAGVRIAMILNDALK